MVRFVIIEHTAVAEHERMRQLLKAVKLLPLFVVFLLTAVCSLEQRQGISTPSAAPTDTPEHTEQADISGYCDSLRNSNDPFFGTGQPYSS